MVGAAVPIPALEDVMNCKRECLIAFGLILIFLNSSSSFSQTGNSSASTPALGDVVKKNKQAGTRKAKVVVNDDNLNSQRGPIPAIALEGVDNSDDIVR